ncbi:MAG: hypothetical protein JWQ04_1979 [Pedosphaera sp.]|nr:hypothetical protein [Pedosphaera sp.]
MPYGSLRRVRSRGATFFAAGAALFTAAWAHAGFTPIPLTSGSFTQDAVVEKAAPQGALNGANTTMSMDAGTANTGNGWYEQGYNTGALGTGLPAAGSTFTDASSPNHSFKMASSYSANNVLLVDATHSGTLTPTTPAAYNALSFLAAAANGPIIIDYTVHHADTSTESGTIAVSDWFGSQTAALNANGRVDVQSGAFDSVSTGNPRLYSFDITLANASSPVTSVDLSYDANTVNGAAEGAIFAMSGFAGGGTTFTSRQIQWGLTLTNINNSVIPLVTTNSDSSLTITAGGGDAYSAPDSFTYAFQQLTGDFDIRVRIVDVTATDPKGQDSSRGSLMIRSGLDPAAFDFMIDALLRAPSGRDGQIECIGRMDKSIDTDDLPGRALNYGGDTTDFGYATYPDVWLRIQRQGDKLMSYFATTNPTDFPSGSSPKSTNGWQLLVVVPTGTNFGKTVYAGLATVAHNNGVAGHVVTATYAGYGNYLSSGSPSIPTSNGALVASTNLPGPFPNSKVLGINWDVSLPANGLGYPSDIVQANQGAAQQIVWNNGGFGSVARDVIDSINSETSDGYSVARYQAGSFDFMLSPRDPVLAQQNLGPYSNPKRERISTGDPTVPASQAWAPSPNYGFVMATVRKNGEGWNDQSPSFYAAAYVQLDGVATGAGYDMIGGHFRGGQFYTRTTKLVTGSVSVNGPGTGNLQRCAVPIGLTYFPYDQGWKAGYIDDSTVSTAVPPIPVWKHGDGWGLYSGTAVSGFITLGGQAFYNTPSNIVSWVDTTGGGTYSGLAFLHLPGVNSTNDGILFTVGNNENNSERGPQANNAALPDGSGWNVAVRDIDTSKADPTVYATTGSDAGSSFSFLYIPWTADNLIAGHIRGTTGATLKGKGTYTLNRLSTGRYALTIPGKTGTNGTLMLINSGYLASQPTVVDNSFLSYEYGGTNTPANAFIIESRYVDASGGGEGVVGLRDADFNFVWVDFQNPLGPPGTIPPVLNISISGNNAIVSWSNGAGFILQTTTSLAGHPTWTPLSTANPQTVSLSAGPHYFRVVSP